MQQMSLDTLLLADSHIQMQTMRVGARQDVMEYSKRQAQCIRQPMPLYSGGHLAHEFADALAVGAALRLPGGQWHHRAEVLAVRGDQLGH